MNEEVIVDRDKFEQIIKRLLTAKPAPLKDCVGRGRKKKTAPADADTGK